MALVKAFTDAAGNDNPNAYFVAVQINFCTVQGVESAYVTFYGYRDKAAHDAGLQPLPGAVKTFRLGAAEFLAIAAGAPEGATLWDALANAIEGYALTAPDGYFQGASRA